MSPKENRDIPPLRHGTVHRLKQDFPALSFIVNGGITTPAQIDEQLQRLDGVMVGREAYHNPWLMADWDERWFGAAPQPCTREEIEARMVEYMREQQRAGEPWSHVSRHMLGLWNGEPGARRWRQVWSDHRLKGEDPGRVSELANRAREEAGVARKRELESA